ncbi:uncharacterized protein LOC126427289 isoform X4 [Schistocerca serialis cubense]|uniref:uncharacterized protein LOC126427289 isoform X4 n=1 Tax=Schistocerca serialis cubense TaxID=2023355 RepID=UPI00214F20A3|nr:uncharacterized protein LOC126427289 isoform X4 [Schistocerca serialis cubense]
MDQDPTMWIKKEETDEEDPMCVEDLLELSWSTDVVKEDPEVNVEVNVTENIVATSTRYACDSARCHEEHGVASCRWWLMLVLTILPYWIRRDSLWFQIHSEYWWELWHFIRRNSSPWTAQG